MNIDTLILLNKTTLRCLKETDENKIIGAFTELGVNILGASFGFVWMRKKDQEFELAYRGRNLPYTPLHPRKGGRNTKVFESSRPDFVSTVQKRKDKYDVSKYVKSFVVIPIAYQHNIYGNIIICFKKTEIFSKEKRILCALIGGNIAHVITVFRQREMLKENAEYRRRMEEEELRTEFLADATHEIRTPIAIIKGTIDLALKNQQNISKLAILKSIDEEVRHLTGILSELSVLTSKDSSVQRKIQTKKIKLVPFVRKISKRWKILADKKSVVIQIEKIPPVSILADESYLDKLFTNIIKNAVIYGQDGGHISIRGTIQGGMIVLDIHDDGIGISAKDLEHIFERFYSVDKSHPNFKGVSRTGLGLAIAKWIAEAHGGEITARSVLGKGSTFSVSLPFI